MKKACEEDGEVFADLVCTLDDEQLALMFDCDYGGTRGDSFTAWGKNWVYFPLCYDGSEWVGRAPRNPCDIVMDHQGGG